MMVERLRVLMYSERTEISYSWIFYFDRFDEVFWANTYDVAVNMLNKHVFHIIFIDYRVIDNYIKIKEILQKRGLTTRIRVVELPLLTGETDKTSNDDEMLLKNRKKVLIFDDLVIDPNSVKVTFQGEEIELTEKEFDLLYCLADNYGQVLSYDDIFERVWKDDETHGDEIIKAHLYRLRKKLSVTNRVYIKNVRGKGYRFSK